MSSRPAAAGQEFKADVQTKLEELKKEVAVADAEILKLQEKLYAPLHEKRDAIVNKVDGFWQQALANCDEMNPYLDDEDWQVFHKLANIKVTKEEADPRNCTITFTFKDNDFLAENVLTKKFTVKDSAAPLGSEDFDWEQDLVPSKCEVKWKSDDVNLCKKNPVKEPTKGDVDTFEPGSFFSTFFECTHTAIVNSIGQSIVNMFYPQVADWYTGEALASMADYDDFDDDEDDEEDDDDADEIDLEEEEKRATKKAKTEK